MFINSEFASSIPFALSIYDSNIAYKNKKIIVEDIADGYASPQGRPLVSYSFSIFDIETKKQITELSSLFSNKELVLYIITNEITKILIKNEGDYTINETPKNIVDTISPEDSTYEGAWAVSDKGIIIRFSNGILTPLAFPTDTYEIPLEKLQKAKPKMEYWDE